MADKKRQRLSLDLEALFPGDTLDVHGTVIDIRPLGIQQLAIIVRKLKGFGTILQEDGVDWENYSQPENILKLAIILLEHFPEVLEEAANVAVEDLVQLPIDTVVLILDKVLEVNLKSKETLEGNFKSLIGKFAMTTPALKGKRK